MVTDDDNENIAFRNIEISNNTFKQFDNHILQISNTDQLSFSNNTNSESFLMLHPENSVITIKNSSGISFSKNEYQVKAKVMIVQHGDMSKVTFR